MFVVDNVSIFTYLKQRPQFQSKCAKKFFVHLKQKGALIKIMACSILYFPSIFIICAYVKLNQATNILFIVAPTIVSHKKSMYPLAAALSEIKMFLSFFVQFIFKKLLFTSLKTL